MSRATTPIAKPENVLLGAGAIYINFDEEDERPLGGTQGGSEFAVEREWYDEEQDGAYGPIKGDRHKISITPQLTVNALELSDENLAKFFPGMEETSNGEYTEYREQLHLAEDDYIKNIAFVGMNQDRTQEIVIILENALADGETSMTIEPKQKVIPEIQFTAHYDPDTPEKIPYVIRKYPANGNGGVEG